MAWRLSSRLARFRAPEPPLTYSDEPGFPAGVVALGRGGAGEVGALLREDGVYIGLLRLAAANGRDLDAVEEFAAVLPLESCQIITTRWPVDAERAGATWRTATRAGFAGAALANEIGAEYLPTLVEAGWGDVCTYLTIQGTDPESLLHDLYTIAAELPLPAHPATLAEAKHLAGDWFNSRSLGLVTIGWSLTELTAEPHPDWARILLETPALAAIPIFLTLHLEPVGAPAPISLELHRRLTLIDSEIEARRRSGQRGGISDCAGADDLVAERRELLALIAAGGNEDDRPRPARLLIGCAVEPHGARALRAEVERALHQLGFLAASFGPGRSDDTLLSCSPLGIALVGRELTLTTRGASLLAPLTPTTGASSGAEQRAAGLPFGLRRDGAAISPARGEDLIAIGAAADGQTAALQTWVLGQLAAGTSVTIIDTGGTWSNVALAAGGEQIQVALELGSLLAGLGSERLRRPSGTPERQIAAWADSTVRLFTDLCPDLDEDECGDLTAYLLALAEGDLAWGEPIQLGMIVTRLRESASEPARHLAALLTATGALRPTAITPPSDFPLMIYDAAAEQHGQQLISATGCAVVALQAALDRVIATPLDPRQPRLLVLDDLAGIIEANAGPALVGELLAEARARGIAIWCAATSLAACPRATLEDLRALDPTAIIFPSTPEALRANARALDLAPGLFDRQTPIVPGEVLLVRAETATPIQIVPLQLPPYALRR